MNTDKQPSPLQEFINNAITAKEHSKDGYVTYDEVIEVATELLTTEREYWLSMQAGAPKIVCLCGSTRFMEAFQLANLKFTCQGFIVLSVGCNTKSDRDLLFSGELTEELKIQLDELHKRKIDLANEIFVLNVGGYIGESTRSEINYAIAHGKPVNYLEPIN